MVIKEEIIGLLHGLFEKQVLLSPESVAIMDGKQEMTYGQLDTLSNQIANQLLEMGLSKGQYHIL